MAPSGARGFPIQGFQHGGSDCRLRSAHRTTSGSSLGAGTRMSMRGRLTPASRRVRNWATRELARWSHPPARRVRATGRSPLAPLTTPVRRRPGRDKEPLSRERWTRAFPGLSRVPEAFRPGRNRSDQTWVFRITRMAGSVRSKTTGESSRSNSKASPSI